MSKQSEKDQKGSDVSQDEAATGNVVATAGVAQVEAGSVPDAKAEEEKKPPALGPNRMNEASYMRSDWFVTAPINIKPSHLLDHNYWAHVGSKLKALDIIQAACEDGSWYARYIVLDADRLWAKIKLLEEHDLTEDRKNMPKFENQNYQVTWKGPLAKFAVVRNSDGAILKDQFVSQMDGFMWLDGHLKAQAA